MTNKRSHFMIHFFWLFVCFFQFFLNININKYNLDNLRHFNGFRIWINYTFISYYSVRTHFRLCKFWTVCVCWWYCWYCWLCISYLIFFSSFLIVKIANSCRICMVLHTNSVYWYIYLFYGLVKLSYWLCVCLFLLFTFCFDLSLCFMLVFLVPIYQNYKLNRVAQNDFRRFLVDLAFRLHLTSR